MLSDEEKEKIRQMIREDLERRLQHDEDEIRRRDIETSLGGDPLEHVDEQRMLEVEMRKVKREEEDRFYRSNPDYVQYVDRFGGLLLNARREWRRSASMGCFVLLPW